MFPKYSKYKRSPHFALNLETPGMEPAYDGRDRVSTQRGSHFGGGRGVLVARETLRPVIPTTWRRDAGRVGHGTPCTTPGGTIHVTAMW